MLSSYNRDLTYVVFGSAAMTSALEFDLSTLDGQNGFTITTGYTDLSNWHLRYHESAHIDDDEYSDIILPNNHEVNIIFGTDAFTANLNVPNAPAGAACTLTFGQAQIVNKIHKVGDVNGDKVDDLIIAFADRAYLVYGGN